VSRLEEFPRSALERVGPFDVVQYRNEILPLIQVSRLLRRRPATTGRAGSRQRTGSPASDNNRVQVEVYAGRGQRVGLVVAQILDIAEVTLASRSPARRAGVEFTAVVQGRVTEFLDLEGIMRSTDPDFFELAEAVSVEA